jgi:uncharacterized membrane protein YhiD involved in acid resistance
VNQALSPEAWSSVSRAFLCLPLAALIGSAIAFRPRRRSTPLRSAPVIQTQILLAVIGALVMLVVGSSVTRALGVAGVTNLIRYRSAIDDPKDAVVALVSLSLGLATGVELYALALVSAAFILALLWSLESLEPERRTTFELTVGASDPSSFQPRLERLLRRHRIRYELRSTGAKEIVYQAEIPPTTGTGRLSDAILRLPGEQNREIRWVEAKETK